MTLSLAMAQRAIEAAFQSAVSDEVQIAVTVVDRGGRVLASSRDESVGYVNLEIAEKKAVAALNFGMPTHVVLDMVKSDSLLLQSVTSQPSLSLLPGGFAVRLEGTLVGAIGVAGGHYTQDQKIAEAALAVLG